jgi:ferredoxin-NADP reductase
MLSALDGLLNRVTMYRLVLYTLIGLLAAAVAMSFAGLLPTDPLALLLSIGWLVAVCALTNWLFSRAFGVPANAESAYISALILALILDPVRGSGDLWFLGWAAVWAMASKYIVALNRKHLFNPVAFAVALTYFTLNRPASWWVGAAPMLPFVALGALLMVRKLGRFDLVLSFLLAATLSIVALSLLAGQPVGGALLQTLLYSPLLFFAGIILTEPLTTPPTRRLRIVYGALVGVLFAPQIHLGAFYMTPELAILAGNVFAYLVSPKARLVLQLKEKVQLAPDVYDFIFAAARPLAFAPGQYMEWTLGHPDTDSRGNRRYFTLASAPTENTLRLGVKFSRRSSSFKRALLAMPPGREIVAAQLAGDFVLPDDPAQKCVFIAGGVGITPFRSMFQYLLDTHQRRPITLFYVNRSYKDIVYRDVLDRARRELGIDSVYVVGTGEGAPLGLRGHVGRFTCDMIEAHVPDFRECVFYLSGSKTMIDSFREQLRNLRVPAGQIKTDFFAGLA